MGGVANGQRSQWTEKPLKRIANDRVANDRGANDRVANGQSNQMTEKPMDETMDRQ